MKKLITLENVSKIFIDEEHRRSHVLDHVNLDIHEGEIFVFLGPSGSGKSTLLRILSGLDHEFEGKIITDPSLQKGDIGFIFQQFAILPWLTVYENIELWLIARNVPLAERKKRKRRARVAGS